MQASVHTVQSQIWDGLEFWCSAHVYLIMVFVVWGEKLEIEETPRKLVIARGLIWVVKEIEHPPMTKAFDLRSG